MHTFSIKEAFRSGWTSFKQHLWLLVGSTAFIGAVSMLSGFVAGDDAGLWSFIVNIASTVLMWWLFLGFLRMVLTIYAGGTPGFAVLFGESWDVLWKYAVASILANIIILVGFVLLIVPGFMALTALSLVMFLVLEKGVGPVVALKESRRLTAGKRWDIFWFLILAAVINIAGALLMGLGLLVTVPVTMLAFVHVYKKIDGTDDVQVVQPMEMPAPTV